MVNELFSRFGSDGVEIPLELCPCGKRKATIRRFLIARKYKIDDAEKMLRDTIKWRQSVTIGGVTGVRNIILSKPRWDLLSMNRKIIPATPFLCYTKQGFPVYSLRLGKGDGSLATAAPDECHIYCSIVRGEHLVNKIFPEAQKLHETKLSRRGPTSSLDQTSALTRHENEPYTDDDLDVIDKQIVIVDLDGISMSALRCLYVFKLINSVASCNYPELSKAIYVLNSPTVFDYIWSAIKPLLAAHTRNKVRIFQMGPEQYGALQEILEDDDIPDYLTPQVDEENVKGRVGCVPDADEPDFRPEGVRDLDAWLENSSEALDKTCPFP